MAPCNKSEEVYANFWVICGLLFVGLGIISHIKIGVKIGDLTHMAIGTIEEY